MYLIVCALFSVWASGFVSCNQPKVTDSDDMRYEITFTMGIIGYIYHCDRFTKVGTTYTLYVDNKVTKTFDVGSGVLVEVEKKY